MNEFKELNYNGHLGKEENPLPKMKVEDIPTCRRKKLLCKYLCDVSEDEFEEWLAVLLDFNKLQTVVSPNSELPVEERLSTGDEQRDLAAYYRAEFHHINEFAAWEKENLIPLVKELVDMAENDPQYDSHYLYRLERQKLVCMQKYFSHSRIADENGNYDGKRWLLLCIILLDYILKNKGITKEQIVQMNIKNIDRLTDESTIRNFKEADFSEDKDDLYCDKCFYGRKIYLRKMERLYHLIRIYQTRNWWE